MLIMIHMSLDEPPRAPYSGTIGEGGEAMMITSVTQNESSFDFATSPTIPP